jgi:hypothetical protein
MAVVLFITLLINNKQLGNQKQQLEVSNYAIVFKQFDHPHAKAARRVIYRSHDQICKLVKNYKEKDEDEVLDAINETAKYIVGIYDSIWFLVKDNKDLKMKLITHHGFTMGRLWKILQGLHQTWRDNDIVRDYVGFKELGKKSYESEENKKDIDKFYEENYKKAISVNQEEIKKLKNKILGLE